MKEENLVVTMTPLYDTKLDLYTVAEEVVLLLRKKYPGVNIDAWVSDSATDLNQGRGKC